MATASLPPCWGDLTEPVGQPSRVGQVGQQPGTGVADHPRPSALTVIFGRVPVVVTAQVRSVGMDKTLSKSYLPSSEGHLFLLIYVVDGPITKAAVSPWLTAMTAQKPAWRGDHRPAARVGGDDSGSL
jgi:hypothetical protein